MPFCPQLAPEGFCDKTTLKFVKAAGNEIVTEVGCAGGLNTLWSVLQIKGGPQHGHCSQLPQPVTLSVKHASVDLLVCLLVAWTLRFGSYAYSKSSTKAPKFPDPSI